MSLAMQRLWWALVMVSAVGCASFGKLTSDPTDIVFATDAETNMRLGNEAFENKSYPEAARYFEHVRNKYPYLESAREAELKLADCDFYRDQWASARDRYKNFERLHPTHPQVDYAAYRAAETHYKDIPSDFFLLPPSAEKDQLEVRSALAALNEFKRLYPKSSHVKEADEIVADVKRRLAAHEIYVAEFYARREKWNAVIGRYNTVNKHYAGVGLDEQAAFGLYDAYMALNRPDDAKEALHIYIHNQPTGSGVARATKIIGPELAAAPLATPPLFLSDTPDAGR